MSETTPFGKIEFAGKDIVQQAQYDRIAVGPRGELFLVSVVAATQQVKAMRSIMAGGAKATITANGGKVRQPSAPSWQDARHPGRLTPTAEGYTCYTQKLEYGQAHALFVTRSPGFMKVVTPAALWQELNDSRFTTPILKDWMPYIEAQLREQELLEEASTFNCVCGVLSAHTGNLDEIVTGGLKDGSIQIPA